ncbi:MAG TPA: VacJ family lipoprotein [Synergistetes bacterium]|nr:VacJ family lipoprotein [Synergistota bacterium]
MNKFCGMVLAVLLAFNFLNTAAFGEFTEAQDFSNPRSFLIHGERNQAGDQEHLGTVVFKSAMNERPGVNDSSPFARLSSHDRSEVGVSHEMNSDLIVLAKTEEWEEFPEDEFMDAIADPLEPFNRAMYHFNDKLYFWVLKPVAIGYKAVAPEKVRVGVKNFFYNLRFPIRFINCLLQGKMEGAGNEVRRFVTNTAVGLGGFIDIATNKLEIKKYEEDLGQTLGSYGMGPVLYINWPILGPSNLRDTLGTVGDFFADPISRVDLRTKYRISVRAYSVVNNTSLVIGEYEDFKSAALDPYVAIRDAHYQHRKSMIQE